MTGGLGNEPLGGFDGLGTGIGGEIGTINVSGSRRGSIKYAGGSTLGHRKTPDNRGDRLRDRDPSVNSIHGGMSS